MFRSFLGLTALTIGLIGQAQTSLADSPKITWPCLNPPTIAYDIPCDTVLSDQQSFNCFAWQEFIGVNWPSDTSAPASQFGTPRDMSPVVFETYKNVHDLLKPDGSKPEPWEAAKSLPRSLTTSSKHVRVISRPGKLGNNFDPSSDIDEAAPAIAWLADRDGNLVWYEIFVNKDEYDYFYTNELYNSINQYQAAKTGQKIDLPMGQLDGQTGAMEFKAAWLTVPDPDKPKWDHYKLSTGVFCTDVGESNQVCTENTIALVGLHILHKTTSQPSWTWATFEHIDNAPDLSAVKSGDYLDDYTFFNPDCEEIDIPAACQQEGGPTKTSREPNTPPAYALTDFEGGNPVGECLPYPIQVAREYSLPSTNEDPILQTNAAAHELIRQANPDSVYQYYRLIDVLWNDSAVNENAGRDVPHAPLSETGFRPNPDAFPVANTVLETYVQSTTCVACHSNAKIASSDAERHPTFASDYSFIFGMAGPDPSE